MNELGKGGNIAKKCHHRIGKSTQEDDNNKKRRFNGSDSGSGKFQ